KSGQHFVGGRVIAHRSLSPPRVPSSRLRKPTMAAQATPVTTPAGKPRISPRTPSDTAAEKPPLRPSQSMMTPTRIESSKLRTRVSPNPPPKARTADRVRDATSVESRPANNGMLKSHPARKSIIPNTCQKSGGVKAAQPAKPPDTQPTRPHPPGDG